VSTLFSLAGHIAGAWATATELAPLLLVPALVWGIRTAIELLDRLACLAQLTYRAGRAVGAVWFRHGLPLLLAAADLISALLAEINWAEVRSIVREGLALVAAAVITSVIEGHRLLIKVSAAIGRRYSQLLVRERSATNANAAVITAEATVPAPPVVHPLLELADELLALPHRELQALAGSRRKAPKRELVRLALAC